MEKKDKNKRKQRTKRKMFLRGMVNRTVMTSLRPYIFAKACIIPQRTLAIKSLKILLCLFIASCDNFTSHILALSTIFPSLQKFRLRNSPIDIELLYTLIKAVKYS